MFKAIVSRLALGMVTLLAVTMLIFAATEVLPGDVATAVLGQGATQATVAQYRKQLGLDQPAPIRYWRWLSGTLHGNFGTSMTNQLPVAQEVAPRLRNTLFLAAFAALIAVPLSIALGLLSAIHENGLIDRGTNVLAVFAISFPDFFIAYILIYVFSSRLGLFPSLATLSSGMSLAQRIHHIILPAVALTALVTAHMMRTTRNTILSEMSKPYIETAFLKGFGRIRVIVRHALPNVWAPIITVVALNLAYLVVGVVVIEVVFVYPGIGQLMVDAVSKRDLPVVQACGLIFSAVFVSLNTLSDMLALYANPRLRKGAR
jgi:peptide/nickel transport system permease protein